MLVPVSDHVCAVQAGQIHAAAWVDSRTARERGRRTVDVVCGLKRARHLVVAACNAETSEDLGWCGLSWPPPARHEGYRRCQPCWDQTGRKRPHPGFNELRTAADVLAKEDDRG